MASSSSSSPSSSFFDIEPLVCCETCPCRHAMDACSLCGKQLAGDRDIFMYRGDTPFCSEECRCHQILRDEQASAKNSKPLKDHFTSKEKEQQRRRHETPAVAESGRVKLAADVSVAT